MDEMGLQQGPQGERSDGWEGAREGRSNGWPLGLQPVRVSIASASSSNRFLAPTPPSSRSSSSSSSAFDSESTGSFFPEKSTTLGSLIGIESSSQLAFAQIDSMEEKNSSMEEAKIRRKNTGRRTRSRGWWSLMGCGGSLQNDALDIAAPSLAHSLDKERRETLSQRQTTDDGVGEHPRHEEQEQEQEQGEEQDERVHSGEIVSHRSSPYYDNAGAVADSHRCDPPSLRFILQQPSPSDWNVFSGLSQHHHIKGDLSHGHVRSHTFWPGLCGLSMSVTN